MSRTPVESGVGLSVRKANGSPLYFVAESSILDFVVVLDASLDIDFVYMYFMIGANSLVIEFVNIIFVNVDIVNLNPHNIKEAFF